MDMEAVARAVQALREEPDTYIDTLSELLDDADTKELVCRILRATLGGHIMTAMTLARDLDYRIGMKLKERATSLQCLLGEVAA